MSKLTPISVHDLGGYLREQRQAAQLSLRQLSEVAGVSNPYLSQIERGLKKPSAEILQQLARGLRISAESLYVRAGILEEQADHGDAPVVDVRAAVLADRRLTDRQRSVLLDVYESFVGGSNEAAAGGTTPTETTAVPTGPADAADAAADAALRTPPSPGARRTARSRRLHRRHPLPGVARRRRPPAVLA